MNTPDEKRHHAAQNLTVLLHKLTHNNWPLLTVTETLPAVNAITNHSVSYVLESQDPPTSDKRKLPTMSTLDEKRDHAADKLAQLLNQLTDYDPLLVTLTETLPIIDAIADYSVSYVVDQIYRMADCHHESQSGLLPKSQKQY